jgi:hypothetical protein
MPNSYKKIFEWTFLGPYEFQKIINSDVANDVRYKRAKMSIPNTW